MMTFQQEEDQCKDCPKDCKVKYVKGTRCVTGENMKKWLGKAKK